MKTGKQKDDRELTAKIIFILLVVSVTAAALSGIFYDAYRTKTCHNAGYEEYSYSDDIKVKPGYFKCCTPIYVNNIQVNETCGAVKK